MVEILIDNTKDSIGMRIESYILTENRSERLVHEWRRVVAALEKKREPRS